MMAERPELSPPDLTVVRGQPTATELAALVAVLQTRDAGTPAPGAPGAPAPPAPARSAPARSAWADPASLHGRPLPPPSPGAWRQAFR